MLLLICNEPDIAVVTIATVLFEIVDQATNRLKSFPGLVVKEECHQVSGLAVLSWIT